MFRTMILGQLMIAIKSPTSYCVQSLLSSNWNPPELLSEVAIWYHERPSNRDGCCTFVPIRSSRFNQGKHVNCKHFMFGCCSELVVLLFMFYNWY
jgi:hypothetical protein